MVSFDLDVLAMVSPDLAVNMQTYTDKYVANLEQLLRADSPFSAELEAFALQVQQYRQVVNIFRWD